MNFLKTKICDLVVQCRGINISKFILLRVFFKLSKSQKNTSERFINVAEQTAL